MNETTSKNKTDLAFAPGLPSLGWMRKIKRMTEKVLNNLPLFMFGLLMFVTLALDIF